MAYCPYCGEKTDDEKEDGDVFEDESEESYADSVKEKAADMAEKAAKKTGDMAEKAAQKVSEAAGRAADKFSDAAENLKKDSDNTEE